MSHIEEFFRRLRRHPVIAGLREPGHQLAEAARAGVGVVFILGDDVFALEEAIRQARAAGLLILAHVDLIKGIGKDEAGVRVLARAIGVDGILTTRSALIGAARKEGLISIQRLFALDSESLETGLPAVEKAHPDAVEILPGLVFPLIGGRLRNRSLPPLIAGGLIRSPEQVSTILDAGAIAVSTSAPALWAWRRGPA